MLCQTLREIVVYAYIAMGCYAHLMCAGGSAQSRQDAVEADADDPQLLWPAGRVLWLFKASQEGSGDAPGGGHGLGQGHAEGGCAQGAQEVGERVAAAPGAAAASAAGVADPAVGSGGGAAVVCCEASREAFRSILLMPSMIESHLPDQYVSAIQEL